MYPYHTPNNWPMYIYLMEGQLKLNSCEDEPVNENMQNIVKGKVFLSFRV